MGAEAAILLTLAESIADGSPVDWNAVEARASADERPIIRQLRVLSALATVHRTMPVQRDAPPNAFAARRAAAAPAIGSWAHLDLIERIGGGTFGEVYRAWDRHLERDVALKLLRSEEAADEGQVPRIVTEGRHLARVRHANVVTVHGVAVHDGRVGLWMELIDGATLEQVLAKSGPFSAREAALIGIDLCRALAAIHATGLVHRDVKAQNVMREHGGRIVLMDLGTGREIAPEGRQAPPDLAGTPLYLAPEIFRGGAASERTDLYSLGVLLHHLVTGSFPVRAATIDGLQGAHAHGARKRLRDARADLPTAFVRVVDRATANDPTERYASAGALEADLVRALDDVGGPALAAPGDSGQRPPWYRTWRVAALAAVVLTAAMLSWSLIERMRPTAFDPRSIRSIAVLPLENLSGDPGQDYFVDGMTDALIDKLAKVRALRVISRTSVMQFKGAKKSLREVAQALKVDAVVEGTVVKSGDRVRISADLVHVATDRHVWGESYERDLGDVLALQAEVAQSIAREIQIQLTPMELAGLGAGQSVSAAAEEAYLQGRYFWNKRTDEGLQRALEFFRKASDIDPTFARAYAGQADVYNLLPGGLNPFIAYPRAKAAANTALRLDPMLAEAHTSLGFATFIFDRDWPSAEAAFQRALQYNPGYATAHHWYGEYLSALGRLDEAFAKFDEARALDPLSAGIQTSVGSTLYLARRYDEGITQLRASLDLDAGSPSTYLYLAQCYEQKGMLAEATAEIRRALAIAPRGSLVLSESGRLAALTGDREGALRTAAELTATASQRRIPVESIAYIYLALGQHDRAFEFLRRGAEERSPGLLWARLEPILDPVRRDPRFTELLRQLRLN